MSTVFALSSGSLPAAIAVFRLSGPRSLPALQEISRKKIWKPREMRYTKLWTADSQVLDTAMAVYLPGPSTFTGEDSTELYVHGSRAVAQALGRRLSSIEGVRPAERGEFTKRAFYNGKMDLEEVHGLRHLIYSETDRQRRLSYSQMRAGEHIKSLRDKLADLVMRSFILMDFGEHVDTSYQEIREMIYPVLKELDGLTRRSRAAEIIHRGLRVVLVGRPNTGKSSILNALARREVAIVSEIAGTTRDILEVKLDIDGVPITLTDTAGLRESSDRIEMEGIRRARERLQDADIVLLVTEADTSSEEIQLLVEETEEMSEERPLLVVRNKVDLFSPPPDESLSCRYTVVRTSALNRDGVLPLIEALQDILSDMCPEEDGACLAEPALLEEATKALEMALVVEDAALLSTHLEHAKSLLGQLAGDTVSEELLDRLFNQFCIGK